MRCTNMVEKYLKFGVQILSKNALSSPVLDENIFAGTNFDLERGGGGAYCFL